MGGVDDRGAHGERVGSRTGGGRDDQPVRGIGGEELVVEAHRQSQRAQRDWPLECRLVERMVYRTVELGPRSVDVYVEQHPMLDVIRAGEVPLDRLSRLVRFD